VKDEPPVTPAMVLAGLAVRQHPHMRWETDETRLIAEYRAMVKALDKVTAK